MFSKLLKGTLVSFALVLSAQALAQAPYPTSPDPSLTPGELCSRPSSYRYPEQIKYCERSVNSGQKKQIIREYDKALGYSIGQMNRRKFKIDHYIPLCMGGANTDRNLWPQHESVYSKTDLIEAKACEKMAEGKLSQADAVKLIRAVKNNLSKAREALDWLEQL